MSAELYLQEWLCYNIEVVMVQQLMLC